MIYKKWAVELHTEFKYVFVKEFPDENTALRCFEKHVDGVSGCVLEIRLWHRGDLVMWTETFAI